MVRQTWLLRTCVLLLLTGAALALAGHFAGGQPARPTVPSTVTTATNDFGFRLYANLANSNGEQNLFISPLSLELALAMTYNGARGGTQQAMANTLGLQGLTLAQVNDGYRTLANTLFTADPHNARVLLANSLWLSNRETFLPDFLQRDKSAYQAELATVDFTNPRTVTRVNDWVSAHTAKMIPTIVQPGDFNGATVLALVNALYFKGSWSEAFDKKLTRDGTFMRGNATKKTVPMMLKKGGFFCYEDQKLQIARLPYGNGKLSMLIFLPKTTASGGNALRDFTAQLAPAQWQHWLLALHRCGHEDTLSLPRFKADYSVELSKPLTALGMGIAFGGGADFSGMVKGGGIAIKLVRHKTAIDVNETGTEAAAATVVTTMKMAVMSHFHMVVDHPFFFAIVADDGTILFLGSIDDPR